MKKLLLILISILSTMFCACLKTYEIPAPDMVVSYTEDDTILFSEIQTASLNVDIKCEENLKGFKMYSLPILWKKDTTFQSYTHESNFNLNFTISKGQIEEDDSIFKVTMLAYTDFDTVFAYRTLKYKFLYPEIDSFDVDMSTSPTGQCLLDIKNGKTYEYSQYQNVMYDLVLINEVRKVYNFDVALASPNAPYLEDYFLTRNTSLIYEVSNDTEGRLRETVTGYIPNATSQTKITDQLVYLESGWNQMYLGSNSGYGYGVTSLNTSMCYKVKLYDGTKAILKVIKRKATDDTGTDYNVTIRVFRQKE